MADLALRKSSYSGGEEECVEVATNVPNTVAVRDSKDPEVGAGTSRALRGHLWLDGCGLNDIAVRWSIAAGSRQVASGTMTTHNALESRALTGKVPRQARVLTLTVRRTDSDSACRGVFTWDTAGLEARRH
ncbi:DUF397 domain-containing protein [Streptomyces antimycoticus]